MKTESTFYKLSRAIFFMILVSTFSIACKKEKKSEPKTETEVETPKDVAPISGTRLELTKDSIYLYARQIYLWWDQIPDYNTFKPRSFTSAAGDEANLDAELYAITRFGINPSTNKPYEFNAKANGSDSGEPKYSYISDITQQNPIAYLPQKQSSVDLNGNGYDFGLKPVLTGSPSNYSLYIQAVYQGSDAAAKGIQRGDIITVINGRSFGSNYTAEIDYINNALFESPSVSLKIKKVNSGQVVDIFLNRTSYVSMPVIKDSVYNVSASKKIGYMVYMRFSHPNNSEPDFERVFKRFADKGVTDLIIDLRYNGGGYVSTAENLINFIAPANLNGKLMYSEHFNKLMQAGKATILSKKLVLNSLDKPQDSNFDGKLDTYADVPYDVASNTRYFSKKGDVNNISNVVFIVSGSTASASELVINSLKPYLNVKIVGETTYGKPVGFFPIRLDKYDVYLSMFESKNSKEEGGYFSGMQPSTNTGNTDAQYDNDNPQYEFGDMRENSFLAAFNYLTANKFTSSTKQTGQTLATAPKILTDVNGKKLKDNDFKGMIEDRIKVK